MCHSRRCSGGGFLGLVLLSLTPLSLLAQEPMAALEITVSDATGDRFLAGAQVSIEGLGFRGITDRNGFLRIAEVPSGTRSLEVRYLGYGTLREALTLEAGRLTRVTARLEVSPIPLAEVRVTPRPSRLELMGFNQRKRFGQGTFFTREQIEQIDPRNMSDLLRRIPGIQLTASSGSGARPVARIRQSSCPIQYFVDGALLLPGFNIDYVLPGDVEGVEIYKGAATLPVAYNRGTAYCGLILIWTRVE